MDQILAMLLAGGVGSRLNVLARLRAKPAVPFGGIYRIIDFTLSNIVNSGIFKAGILTQYKPYSLMKHIGTGVPWDFIGRKRTVKILPPATGEKYSDWYKGTADAITQNISFIRSHHPKYTLILSGDHIYYMNYISMVNFHILKNADITVGMMKVPMENANQFGIGVADSEHRIIGWEEKPPQPKSDLASMGIYVFNTDFLFHILNENYGTDFGQHIIPNTLKTYRVFAFPFTGYWQDVGTIQAYWETNMDILKSTTKLNLQNWKIRTNVEEEDMETDRSPSYIGRNARIKNSLISSNCIIEGHVVNSILSPGVRVKQNATIKDSIIMHDTIINENSEVDYVILDKNIKIGVNCMIGTGELTTSNIKNPDHLRSGISIIGKGCTIPDNMRIGRNCVIYPNVIHFNSDYITCGATIESAI